MQDYVRESIQSLVGINLSQNNNYLLRLYSYFKAFIPSVSIYGVPAESGIVLDPKDEVVNRADVLFASVQPSMHGKRNGAVTHEQSFGKVTAEWEGGCESVH